jgi:hypothetical protein
MRTGLELLPADAWQGHAGLWLDLQLGEAEAAYLCGQFDAAEAIYPLVRARSLTPLEQVRCIAVQAHQYQLQGRLLDAIAVLREGLAQLGIDIPHDTAQLKARFDEHRRRHRTAVHGRAPALVLNELLAAGEMSDPCALAALKMMHGLWMASYYAGQQDLSALMVLSMTRLSMQQGNSDFSAVAYVAYAMLLAQQTGDAERGYRFGAMALALARRPRQPADPHPGGVDVCRADQSLDAAAAQLRRAVRRSLRLGAGNRRFRPGRPGGGRARDRKAHPGRLSAGPDAGHRARPGADARQRPAGDGRLLRRRRDPADQVPDGP